jgi:hypothetical protein
LAKNPFLGVSGVGTGVDAGVLSVGGIIFSLSIGSIAIVIQNVSFI